MKKNFKYWITPTCMFVGYWLGPIGFIVGTIVGSFITLYNIYK